ncbi:unnamed protein product [Trichobilharzia regenti]|nr:unnamed protein product [Trichobilharzia regenti]
MHCGYAVAKQAAQRHVKHVYLMKSTGVKHVPKEASTKGVKFIKGKSTYLNTIFTSYSSDNVILASGKPDKNTVLIAAKMLDQKKIPKSWNDDLSNPLSAVYQQLSEDYCEFVSTLMFQIMLR